MIDRNNITVNFLKKQGQQLYRIPVSKEFSFAYHPWKSSLAPEIGYIIRSDQTLKKIFHVKNSKTSFEKPSIILHIVFEDQYYLYDDKKSPFSSQKKKTQIKPKINNNDLDMLAEKHKSTFDHTQPQLDRDMKTPTINVRNIKDYLFE